MTDLYGPKPPKATLTPSIIYLRDFPADAVAPRSSLSLEKSSFDCCLLPTSRSLVDRLIVGNVDTGRCTKLGDRLRKSRKESHWSRGKGSEGRGGRVPGKMRREAEGMRSEAGQPCFSADHAGPLDSRETALLPPSCLFDFLS